MKSQLAKKDRQQMMFEAFVHALIAATRILQFSGHPYAFHYLAELRPVLESATNFMEKNKV